MLSPPLSHWRQYHVPPSPWAGQKRKRSFPPQAGQGHAHSPPWVPATLTAFRPRSWMRLSIITKLLPKSCMVMVFNMLFFKSVFLNQEYGTMMV